MVCDGRHHRGAQLVGLVEVEANRQVSAGAGCTRGEDNGFLLCHGKCLTVDKTTHLGSYDVYAQTGFRPPGTILSGYRSHEDDCKL